MPFNETQHRQQTLDWYLHLAELPAWKAYVWARVNEIAQEHPAMHHDLPSRLVAAVRARKAKE